MPLQAGSLCPVSLDDDATSTVVPRHCQPVSSRPPDRLFPIPRIPRAFHFGAPQSGTRAYMLLYSGPAGAWWTHREGDTTTLQHYSTCHIYTVHTIVPMVACVRGTGALLARCSCQGSGLLQARSVDRHASSVPSINCIINFFLRPRS